MVKQIIEMVKHWFRKDKDLNPDDYVEFEWSFTWPEVGAMLLLLGVIFYLIWR